jgi:KDO2-lipid IV(A) lauroyltransferase
MQSSYLVYIVFRSFLLVASHLPFRVNAVLGRLIGRAYYRIDRARRRFARANISIVFGKELDDRGRDALGRRSCEMLAMNILDLLKFDRIVNPENFRQFIEITGFSHLMKSVDRGEGTVVVSGHFGNVFLLRYACYLNIPPRAAVIRKLDNPYLERYLSSLLNSHNVTVIRPDGALKRMNQLLLQNAITVTLADQKAGGTPRVGRHGIVTDFFGIPSQTHITAPLLARRSGASVLTVFVIRKGPGRYRIEINEPMNLVHTDDEQADLKRNTQTINRVFEEYIRKYPDQWFWQHRRWKDIAGLEDLYETSDPLALIRVFRSKIGKGLRKENPEDNVTSEHSCVAE